MIAAHLFCLVASCILWGLHMCTVFPHLCCHLVSLVHSELAVTINPSHPSPSCLSIMCLCVSTDFTVLSNTLIPLNMSVFTDCLFTYWLVSRCQIPWKHAVKCLKIFWYFGFFLSIELTKCLWWCLLVWIAICCFWWPFKRKLLQVFRNFCLSDRSRNSKETCLFDHIYPFLKSG